MLLTISCHGENAPSLGYLLHKNPARPQTIELSYGKAHVFYPETDMERSTAALLLDINPIDLAKGRKHGEDGLFDYVNDRPYAASSLLSTAISGVFGTAMSGRCNKKPELALTKLPLTAAISVLSSRGEEVIAKLFEPLGYTVVFENIPLDPAFPEWGNSRYYKVSVSKQTLLSELLTHLYVLIPVLDNFKHYWIGEDEIEKLLKHGDGWLQTHPMKEYIASRYLKRRKYLVNKALDRLSEDAEETGENEKEAEQSETEKERLSLNQRRLGSVAAALKNIGAKRIIDLGCGEGRLLSLLLKDGSFTEIAGMDVSSAALENAKDRLRLDRLPEQKREKIILFQGSILYKDKRLLGYDACAVVEVIEHLDEARLSSFEKAVFGFANPPVVILTTPNREYNKNYALLHALRHSDHRFEWTRNEFRRWSERVAQENGYSVRFSDIGDADPILGPPTQMAVFTR